MEVEIKIPAASMEGLQGINLYAIFYFFDAQKLSRKKGKALPVTGRGGPWSCETPRLPHF
jgi:hypothetical protein